MVKKRSRIEVIKDILSVILNEKNSILATPLMRKSNMPSSRFSSYMDELMNKGFVKEIDEDNGKKYYSLSDKGFEFLNKYESIKRIIEDFDL